MHVAPESRDGASEKARADNDGTHPLFTHFGSTNFGIVDNGE